MLAAVVAVGVVALEGRVAMVAVVVTVEDVDWVVVVVEEVVVVVEEVVVDWVVVVVVMVVMVVGVVVVAVVVVLGWQPLGAMLPSSSPPSLMEPI